VLKKAPIRKASVQQTREKKEVVNLSVKEFKKKLQPVKKVPTRSKKAARK
jgi:hypothetical protein